MQVPSPAAPHAPVHVPVAPHVGVRPEHAAQVAPPLPHVALVCVPVVTQLVPWQQPPAHDAALHAHTPATHACPAEHVPHARPPPPHAAPDVPVWQVPVASQHPVGHVVELHAPHV